MKLSTRARYGMRAMVDLALRYDKSPVLLKDIATRQGVSMKYLDHIVSTLRARNLIRSPRARHSGYTLSRPPSEITAHEILRAVEGSLALVECVDDPKVCDRSESCATIYLWRKLKDSMTSTLDKITLQDLAEEQREILVHQRTGRMYHI